MPLSKPTMEGDDRSLQKWLDELSNKLFYMKEYTCTCPVTVSSSGSKTVSVPVKGIKKDDPSVVVNIPGAPDGLIVSNADISSNDIVTVNVDNVSASNIDQDINFKFMVMKRV